MPTKADYYNFIKSVQSKNAECKGASKLKVAEMRNLAIKLGYVQAGGIVAKAVNKKKPKKPVVEPVVEPMVVEPVAEPVVQPVAEVKEVKPAKKKVKKLTDDEKKVEKKRLMKEYKNIEISVDDTVEVGMKKKAEKDKILKQMKKL